MTTCTIPGCNRSVSKPGYKLCYEHWKEENSKAFTASDNTSRPVVRTASKPTLVSSSSTTVVSSLLSATKISEQLRVSKNKVNPLLAELGLIDKVASGWIATQLGINFGGVQKCDEKDGRHYVVWSNEILTNQVFVEQFIRLAGSESEKQDLPKNSKELEFRQKFPADHRTDDGHLVRSKAEQLIDNWLYYAGIVHAYERRLPAKEEVYCDFYIPVAKLYIEYWGYDQDPKYLARKQEKQRIYRENNFKLLELSDEHIKSLDDYLPKMLRDFGITVS